MDDNVTSIGPNFDGSSPDTFIGPYKLLRQIGEGGMGVVYHAQQLRPIRREVALKIIKPGMDSKQVIARFETERQALAVMDHPNIARVIDADATRDGRPYFVMELVDGTPITQYCASKRLSVRDRIELFISVCGAIQHAHQKGIIHRDIKPSNILVAEHEGKPISKVIDFGLAKALGPQLSDASMMTNLGTVVGTLDYMSPEQAELTRQDVDTRADVYSLGAVLYELLTGTTPLKQERLASATYIEILQRIREEEPDRPSTRLRQSASSAEAATQRRSDPARLPKLLQGELDWITMKALEKDRLRRYETVNGLARDLQRHLEGEPVEAGPVSASYRLGKFLRKHRLGLATAAAFAVLLVAGVVVSSWLAIKASRAEQEARAVNDFLQNDLLAQASANTQARPDTKPDPDLTVRTALDRAAAQIEGKFVAQPLLEASIRLTIAKTYVDLGLYPDAERHLDRVLELRRRALGEKHADTLSIMNELGDVYTYQGKFLRAESLLTNALELDRRVFGEESSETLSAMNNLALAYSRNGKYSQSEPLYLRILELRRRMLGDEHQDTALTMNNLGILYRREGKYAQAELLLTKTLEVWQRTLGVEHPSTMTAKNNLALVYDSLGKYAEAEPFHAEVVEFSRRVLGEEHPNTITAMGNLGMLYRLQGRYSEAESLLMKALTVGRRVQGEENPNTLLTKYKLAELYRAQRKYEEAGVLFGAVLESRRRVLGLENLDTLNTFVSLGRLRISQQRYADAETLLKEALSSYEKAAPQGLDLYACQSMLGASLAGQKKYVEAEPLLVSGYQGMIERREYIPAERRSDLEETGNQILSLYQNLGRPQKAAEWREKVQRGVKQN